MFSKEDALDALSREDLTELVALFGLTAAKRTKQELIAELVRSSQVELDLLLEVLPLDRLRCACRMLGVDDGSHSRASLVRRITQGQEPAAPGVTRGTAKRRRRPVETIAVESASAPAPLAEEIAAEAQTPSPPTLDSDGPIPVTVAPVVEPTSVAAPDVAPAIVASDAQPLTVALPPKNPGFILVRKSEREAQLAKGATGPGVVAATPFAAHPVRSVVQHNGDDLFRQAAAAALQEWQRRGNAGSEA